jgi:plastocyanin
MPLAVQSVEPLAIAPVFAAAHVRTVRIKDIAFNPERVTIRRGSEVKWRFLDGLTYHNVHSVGSRKFKGSRDRRKGDFTVRFRHAGRYRYVCTLHPIAMEGLVVVR